MAPYFPAKPARRILSGAVSLISALSAVAGFAQSATPLTWDASVNETARTNSELNSSQHSQTAADDQLSAAYSGFLPQVSGSIDYTRGSGSSVTNNLGGTSIVSTGAKNSYSASLTATESLFSGLSDRAKVDQAKANLSVSGATLDTTRAKISYDLKSAFSGLVFAQNSVKLTADIVKRREANLRLVQLRFETGRENQGSVLLSKAYLEQAKYDLLQAENALSTARIQFARVLGRNESDELEITGEVPTSTPPPAVDLPTLAAQTPAFRQAAAQEISADAGITAARSQFFPSLNLTGTTARTGDEWFPQSSRWSLGVGVTVPIFNGGRDFYGTKAATQTWKAATETRENTLRATLVALKQNYSGFVEAVQKLEVDRAFRVASESRERIAKEKYNNGLLTFDDWDIIENDLISREKSFIQSERDRVVAEAAWEQALGKGVLP